MKSRSVLDNEKATNHLHEFHSFGKTYIFDGFRLQTFRLGKRSLDLWRRFRDEDGSSPLPATLSDTDKLVLKNLSESNLLAPSTSERPRFETRQYKKHVNYIMLQIAEGCNLRCGYCFSSQGQYGNADLRLMSFEVAKNAVDFLFASCEEKITPDICFFGGEPLLHFELMRQVVEYAKDKADECNKNVTFSITTNGTLLSDTVVEYLVENEIDTLVSVDGIGKENDIHRKLPNGEGSFSCLQPILGKIVTSLNCRARVTLAKGNCNIEKIVLDILKFGFSGVHVSMSTGADAEAIGGHELKKVLSGLDNLADHYLSLASRNIYFPFLTLHEELHNLRTNRILNTGCGAGRNFLTVMPDGNMYACTRSVGNDDPLWVGNVINKKMNHSLREFFWMREVDNHPVCSKCWTRYLCSGGCFAKNVASSGSFTGVDEDYCSFRKRTLELAIAIHFELKYLNIDPAFSNYDKEALHNLELTQ